MQEALVALCHPTAAECARGNPELFNGLAQEAALLAAGLSQLAPRSAEERKAPVVVAVDDDEGYALSALRPLLAPEFELLVTTDPHQALALVRDQHPDAVLTDLRMREMSGSALVAVLQGNQSTADIPCLVLSASSDVDEKVRALEAGAVDFITKPVAIPELAARLRNAIQRQRALKLERAVSEIDELTALPNRRAMRACLERSFLQARTFKQALTIVMIDLDELKVINDRLGHQAGDAAIRHVAGVLAARKRSGDMAARFGGDEFILILPGSSYSGASALMKQISDELSARPFLPKYSSLRLSLSFGIASFGELSEDTAWEQLLARADEALYQHKGQRKSGLDASVEQKFPTPTAS